MWFRAYRFDSNSRTSPFIIDLSSAKLENFSSPLDCAVDAVQQIANNYAPPYTLLVSGGVDSQAMLHIWQQSQIPFRVVSYNYMGYNSHDTEFLIKYCALKGIDYELVDFDAVKFITGPELLMYAKKYDCSSPQILIYIKLAEQHSETVVMSGNVFNLDSIGINYTQFALDRFRQLSKQNFIPFFFSSTPSITFLKNYIIDKDLPTDRRFKYEVYRHIGADIIEQPSSYTGFEKIKDLFDSQEVPLKLKVKYMNQSSKRPFDLLYRYALYDHIGLYREKTVTII
jgi:hypothetical protein